MDRGRSGETHWEAIAIIQMRNVGDLDQVAAVEVVRRGQSLDILKMIFMGQVEE